MYPLVMDVIINLPQKARHDILKIYEKVKGYSEINNEVKKGGRPRVVETVRRGLPKGFEKPKPNSTSFSERPTVKLTEIKI